MKLRYSYHSEHHGEPRDRWAHFLLFLAALLLLFAAAQQAFLFFTDWHASDEDPSWWPPVLGLLYLTVGGALAYLGYRHERGSRGGCDRYVRVGEDELVWSLTQRVAEDRLPLAEIVGVEQPTVRELRLTLRDGTTVVLPFYLITSTGKQEELLAVLREVSGASTPR